MRLDRRTRRLDPASLRLPLIALIDVVLFLLLYFIFAGSLEAEERQLAVALRTEGGAAPAGEATPQVLSVEVGGEGAVFRIGERVFGDRASLREAMSSLPREAGINVQVADNAPVWAAAAAVQACHDAGFEKIGYMPAQP